MKIAFWSPVHGQAKISSNICAIAIASSIMNDGSNNIITESDGHSKSLRVALTGKSDFSKKVIVDNIGMTAVINFTYTASLNDMALNSCSINLMSSLSYIPGISNTQKKLYKNYDDKLKISINKMDTLCDNLFVDVGAFRNELTLDITRNADIIVVCLPQNVNLINKFFKGFSSYGLDSKKIVYVIGAYDDCSSYSIKNIMRMYDEINRHNFGVIPYNIEFSDAFNDGNVVEFIRKNYSCSKNDDNYFFISSVKKCVDLIFQLAIDRQVVK